MAGMQVMGRTGRLDGSAGRRGGVRFSLRHPDPPRRRVTAGCYFMAEM